MNRPLSLSLLLETVISNLDRRWVPKRAGYKLFWLWFPNPTALGDVELTSLTGNAGYLDKFNPALTKPLDISLEAASAAVLWFPHELDEVPRVFGSHLYGKAPENSQAPFPPSSLLPLLPGLPASFSTGWSWQPCAPQVQGGSASSLSRISMTVEVPYL